MRLTTNNTINSKYFIEYYVYFNIVCRNSNIKEILAWNNVYDKDDNYDDDDDDEKKSTEEKKRTKKEL